MLKTLTDTPAFLVRPPVELRGTEPTEQGLCVACDVLQFTARFGE
jgi:hypothetical protein